MLHRREDLHCIVYHLAVVACYATAFWLWLHPGLSGLSGFWPTAVFVAVAAPLLGWISGIDIGVNYHNHTHRPLFRSRFTNRWFERLWTPFNGWPARYWAHYHVAVHHGRLMSDGDWTVRQRRPDGSYEGCRRYQFCVWPWRSLRNFPREVRAGHFPRRTAVVELLWFLAIYWIPFAIDPLMGLCLWLLPHWCGNCITMGRGMFIQHAGCEPWLHDPRHPHSVDVPLPFYNATMFNIGYHAVHHDFPGRHWSELPELDAQCRRIAAERAQREEPTVAAARHDPGTVC